MKATLIPGKDATPQEIIRRSWEPIRNTCPFNVTGHPAISLPCGMEDGRPIGLMLVGRHYAEETIYRAAAAFAFSESKIVHFVTYAYRVRPTCCWDRAVSWIMRLQNPTSALCLTPACLCRRRRVGARSPRRRAISCPACGPNRASGLYHRP